MTTKSDRAVVRALAARVAEIAALPVQQETIGLWKALNGLSPRRPMVMMDQLPWHEMDADGSLSPACEGELARAIETGLRRTLYRWEHVRVDMVVEPVVDVEKTIRGVDFGLATVEETSSLDAANDVVGHWYYDQLAGEEDLEKIRAPRVSLDAEATAEREAAARELLGGLLEVRMQGTVPMFAAWDRIVQWRGGQNVLMDLAARPEHSHRIMARLTEAFLCLLDQLEGQGLLPCAQPTIHCTGAWTDELPAPGYDAARPRAKDLWTAGMAQIFSTVSPAMHQEFDVDYAVRWYDRFGLGYYGCCEPLDGKLEMVRRIPHLRKVSMSPWVDVDRAAERIGPALVFSRKPNPAMLADHWEPEGVEADLHHTVDRCRRHGVPLELTLKDVSTVGYRPERLWEWAAIARRVVEG